VLLETKKKMIIRKSLKLNISMISCTHDLHSCFEAILKAIFARPNVAEASFCVPNDIVRSAD